MARHSSVSKVDRSAQRKKDRIGNELRLMTGDNKSLRFKDYDRLLSEAEQKFGIIAALNRDVDIGGEIAVTARRKLREMKEVKYYVDKAPAAGDLHRNQSKPHRKVKG